MVALLGQLKLTSLGHNESAGVALGFDLTAYGCREGIGGSQPTVAGSPYLGIHRLGNDIHICVPRY